MIVALADDLDVASLWPKQEREREKEASNG